MLIGCSQGNLCLNVFCARSLQFRLFGARGRLCIPLGKDQLGLVHRNHLERVCDQCLAAHAVMRQ